MDEQHRYRETGPEQWLAARGHFGPGLRRLPYVCEPLFSDAIDEAERARLAGDHPRLRKTPRAEQAVDLKAHYKRFLEKQAERISRLQI